MLADIMLIISLLAGILLITEGIRRANKSNENNDEDQNS